VYRDYVLYKSSDDGLVNIFAVKIDSGMRYRVTSSRFGADYPTISPTARNCLFSDYTSEGYNLAEIPLDPSS